MQSILQRDPRLHVYHLCIHIKLELTPCEIRKETSHTFDTNHKQFFSGTRFQLAIVDARIRNRSFTYFCLYRDSFNTVLAIEFNKRELYNKPLAQ